MHALFGRDDELAAVRRVITDARLGSSAVLVIRGEPGMGKSALLEAAAEAAAADGMQVLRARGVESEAEVPFGGLLELLRPALGTLDRIPPAQADALRNALDLGGRAQQRDRFAIGAAILNLLSAHSEGAPSLVTVDDAQWLDGSSLAALVFAARRLLVDPVAVLFAARTDEAPMLDAARLPELVLNGVDRAAAAEIAGLHAPAPIPPDGMDRLLHVTGGNPLALVELSRAGAAGTQEAPGELEPETSVERTFGHRIASLPAATKRVLALAAAEDEGRLSTIAPAAETLGLRLEHLEPAERAGLVSISYGELSWRHPLVRSASYRAAPPDDRRAMHAALAGALRATGNDARAWHRAAAALGPDEGVAQDLEDAAVRARARTAYATAAIAAERAAQLTPDAQARARRLALAADAAWLGGQTERAGRLLDEALTLGPDEPVRGEIQHLRGQARILAGDLMAGHDLLVNAAEETAARDPGKAVVMLAEATDACVYAAQPRRMLASARRGYELLPADATDRERFFAALALGQAMIYNQHDGTPHLRDAVAILEASDALRTDPRSLAAAALAPLWLREAEVGAALIDRAIDAARTQGALGALPFALTLAAREAATSDRWAVGRSLYEEAIDLARETDQTLPLAMALAGLGSIHARQGDEGACRSAAGEALALSDRHGLTFFRIWALDALADLALGRGDLSEAAEHLGDKRDTIAAHGLTDPDLSPIPELVETAVRAGREPPDPSDFARVAEVKGQPWALARLERSRGIVAQDADPHFERALRLHADTRDRFEEARTQLCFGERLRRTGQRVRAREQLRAALETFDHLQATPWGDRARAELEASGERARRRDPTSLDDLTPQELQIGMLLASGATTREAAGKLFLSPKTVEYHLRNVYRKLGIHSREELRRELQD